MLKELAMQFFTVILILYIILGPMIWKLNGLDEEFISTIIVTGSLGVIFANLDKLKYLKFWGFESEFEHRVQKIRTDIDEIKKLAVLIAKPLLGLTNGSGRWGGLGAIRHVMERDLIQGLKALDLNEEQYAEALSINRHYHLYDHVAKIIRVLPEEVRNENKSLIEQYHDYGDITKHASPEQIRSLVEKQLNSMNEEISELIKDYQHYLEHKEYRRPELWHTSKTSA